MNRATILDTARQAVTTDRAATHGNAENGFALIGALWSADLGVTINATDVARLMVLFKAARAKANPGHADNWVDAAGYAACGGEIATAAPEHAKQHAHYLGLGETQGPSGDAPMKSGGVVG
jgi:hypothetical protein